MSDKNVREVNCELDYCIYNRSGKCIVGQIQINSFGMCDEFIIVSIDKEYLEGAKQKQLEDIELRLS